MTTKVTPATLPILEFDDTGRHRIVIPQDDGTCTACDWAPVTETIFFMHLFAAGNNTPLPPGLFTVREVAHQVLA